MKIKIRKRIVFVFCIIGIVWLGYRLQLERGEQKTILEDQVPKQYGIVNAQENINAEKKFDSVEKMKKATLRENDVVKTVGYYENSIIGAAEYKIISKYLGKEDGLHIELGNGLWAEMIVKGDSVNPAQFGAYGDGLHDDTVALQQAILSGYVVECEKNATYTLSKGIMIPSKSILNGNNAKMKIDEIRTFYHNEENIKENNSKGLFYYQFFMPQQYYGQNELLEWRDVTIEWNVEQKLNHVETYYIFMPNHVKNIEMQKINIYIRGNESNGIQPIKFNGSAEKVRLNECDIRNYTHGFTGSCLWFNVGVGGYPDFIMSDSYFYSEAKDEVISVWGRYGENILFQNCIVEKKNVHCYDVSRQVKHNKSDVIIVSKASKRSVGDEKSNATHRVTYKNCNFISEDESSYFFATNSYYGEEMITSFIECNIVGESNVSFLTAENRSNPIDGITNIDSNQEFLNSLKVTFQQCDITWSSPTIAMTHAPNFCFSNCNITVNNHLIDLTWPSNRLLNCWSGEFNSNNININYADGVFVNISDSYYVKILCTNNIIKLLNTSDLTTVEILSKQNYNINKLEKRHFDGAEYQYIIENNNVS